MSGIRLKPDHLFEVSWEVCNKVGGIHAVLSTKARLMQQEWGDQFIMIGPDLSSGTGVNPEFAEDKQLFSDLKTHMHQEGLQVRAGRWNIPGSPLVVLVDFTPLYQQKNTIFGALWTRFHLDSLTGQWDYVEPAIFGYAAARVIRCFYSHHLNATDRIVAQFHEWMTGAGILHLEEYVPQIATVFTTHATVLGRTIAGNGQPFYSRFDTLDPDRIARELNVVAKHSLEKTAARNADCFTCVSEFTGRECEKFLGKRPDFITPNGFDASFVPDAVQFMEKRTAARKKIQEVAAALLQQPLPENSLLVIKSGRYEFRNKGIDVFIDSLALLNTGERPARHIIAIIFVPAHHTGPRKLLQENLASPTFSGSGKGQILTHNLQGADTDPVLNRLAKCHLDNSPGSRVHVMFVPTYLNGSDGIFNMPYYDILAGFDLAIFPSYYEPWGYTPMESLAFHVPAVTTSLSGFGIAVSHSPVYTGKGIYIVERSDDNEQKAAHDIADIIRNYAAYAAEEIKVQMDAAAEISKQFLWSKLFYRYQMAYDFALEKTMQREVLFRSKPQVEPLLVLQPEPEERPGWRNIHIRRALPAALGPLGNISRNIWCSWNPEAKALFSSMNGTDWEKSRRNPTAFLASMPVYSLVQLEHDSAFINRCASVVQAFDRYMKAEMKSGPLIAYFCMEFGLLSDLKLYAGGLGILAGDYLKAASDNNVNMAAVGLYYKRGYFRQKISHDGLQSAVAEEQSPDMLPLVPVYDELGKRQVVSLAFPGRTVCMGIWKADVGRVPLYLLDTDMEENRPEDRLISAQLYSGDAEMRLKQEIVLGIGGTRMLALLGISPDVYHINEGHAAFAGFERIHAIMHEAHLSFDASLEFVKATTQFTTHTSEPAAMDMFSEELLRAYLSYLVPDFNISWNRLMGLGRTDANNKDEKFSMFFLATRLSRGINAVSGLHRESSRKLISPLWKSLRPGELHLDCIRNGVHLQTWMNEKWQELSWYDPGKKITRDLPDETLWAVHLELKRKLIQMVRERILNDRTMLPAYADAMMDLLNGLDPHALFIGFARRATPYKRADLLFTDIQRLAEIAGKEDKPVVIFVAGKAHPEDDGGKNILKRIISAAQHPLLKNKVLFLDDYDMELATGLVQGVDLWMNTPRPGKEASGTSGMKAAMNGVLHCSTEDGWWADAADGEAGWTLKSERIYRDTNLQDREDALLLYDLLEKKIVPLYFNRDRNGTPLGWVRRMKSAFSALVPVYNMDRVVEDYLACYKRLHDNGRQLQMNQYQKLDELVAWKKGICAVWDQIHLMSLEQPVADDVVNTPGELFIAKMELYIGEMSKDDIEVEVVFSAKDQADNYALVQTLSMEAADGNRVTFSCRIPLMFSGVYQYCFRVRPKHPYLQYPQDFPLIKWI